MKTNSILVTAKIRRCRATDSILLKCIFKTAQLHQPVKLGKMLISHIGVLHQPSVFKRLISAFTWYISSLKLRGILFQLALTLSLFRYIYYRPYV